MLVHSSVQYIVLYSTILQTCLFNTAEKTVINRITSDLTSNQNICSRLGFSTHSTCVKVTAFENANKLLFFPIFSFLKFPISVIYFPHLTRILYWCYHFRNPNVYWCLSLIWETIDGRKSDIQMENDVYIENPKWQLYPYPFVERKLRRFEAMKRYAI